MKRLEQNTVHIAVHTSTLSCIPYIDVRERLKGADTVAINGEGDK